MTRSESSRTRYRDYKTRTAERRREPTPRDKRGNRIERTRGFGQLIGAFWGLLRGHRLILAAALVTLTLSTLIALVPLYAPKFVIDNVLGGQPMPAALEGVLPGSDQPKTLLFVLVAVTLALTFLSVAIGLWGRWHATRITKRLQSDVRRKTFEHAARLPLHRVY
ncbi:MAG: ABC transporter ATP-binding protein, partial [Planctomycetota bacterium]